MIDKETKKKLLEELERNGIVLIACHKAGVSRSAFYRWQRDDLAFRKKSMKALQYGRLNICDIAEGALLNLIKKGDRQAILYALSRLHSRYRQKRRDATVTMIHKKELPPEKSQSDPAREILQAAGLLDGSIADS